MKKQTHVARWIGLSMFIVGAALATWLLYVGEVLASQR